MSPLQHPPGQTSSLTRLQEIQGQLRDIHPGPPLESASDPRLLAWGCLLIALLAALLIGATINTLWRQRRWARQIDWQAADLVPYLRDLGVSDCYASPYLKARPGSTSTWRPCASARCCNASRGDWQATSSALMTTSQALPRWTSA